MAKWQGTAVPNSGYVEKVYFNNKLSADEVYNILSQLTYIETPFLTYPVYPILFANDGNPVMFVAKYIGSVSNLTYYDIFLSTDITNPETAVTILNMDSSNDILIVEFNNTEYTINKEVINDYSGLPIGIQNDLISSLVSSTPFTQSQQTTADKLQKLIDGKQYVVDKTNAKAGSDLKINSTWQSIGDVIEGISGGGGQELVDSIIDNTIESLTTNVESIGNYKLYRNGNLKTFNAPNLKTIGQYTFQYCTALDSIDLPLVTSIGNYNFSGCTSLKNVNLPLVTSIGTYNFHECTSLKNVNLPLVTSIGISEFYRCTSLDSIDLPLTTVLSGNAFAGCTSLADLYLGYKGVVSLNNVSAFNNGATNTVVTVVHVRADYADSYATATNWSSLIESGRITIVGDYSD